MKVQNIFLLWGAGAVFLFLWSILVGRFRFLSIPIVTFIYRFLRLLEQHTLLSMPALFQGCFLKNRMH